MTRSKRDSNFGLVRRVSVCGCDDGIGESKIFGSVVVADTICGLSIPEGMMDCRRFGCSATALSD